MPLLMINNKRIDIESAEIDWSQFDLEKELRGLNEEQREEKLGQIAIIKEMEKSIERCKITLEKLLKNKER